MGIKEVTTKNNSKGQIQSRRLSALNRRQDDIATLESGNIPGMENTPQSGDLHHATASRIIKEKLAVATIEVERLKRKIGK